MSSSGEAIDEKAGGFLEDARYSMRGKRGGSKSREGEPSLSRELLKALEGDLNEIEGTARKIKDFRALLCATSVDGIRAFVNSSKNLPSGVYGELRRFFMIRRSI